MAEQIDWEKENQLLRNQIEQLQTQIQQMPVLKVIQQKEVQPSGYAKDMRRLNELEKEIRRLRRILEFGNVTVLDGLITDYKAVSKPRLEKIVQEYQFCYADHQERLIVKEFINYLQSVVKQLQEFIFLDETGEKNEKA